VFGEGTPSYDAMKKERIQGGTVMSSGAFQLKDRKADNRSGQVRSTEVYKIVF
jgi:adhesin HecA-like repeat protein